MIVNYTTGPLMANVRFSQLSCNETPCVFAKGNEYHVVEKAIS